MLAKKHVFLALTPTRFSDPGRVSALRVRNKREYHSQTEKFRLVDSVGHELLKIVIC